MAETDLRSDGKRRLPLLQEGHPPPDPPAEDSRSPRTWIAIGTLATFLVWLPLAWLADAGVRRFVAVEDARGVPTPAGVWLVAAHAFTFFASGLLSGLLVGRAGGAAGVREATLGAACAGVLAWLLAATQGTPGGPLVWGLLLAIISSLGALAGKAGGHLGLAWRRRA